MKKVFLSLQSLTIIVLTLTSCATLKESIILGSGVGLTTGAAFGAGVGHSSGQTLQGGAIGAVSGAVLGGLFGYLTHRDNERRRKVSVGPALGDDPPSLTKPIVRRVWIPDRIDGDRYERGHWMFQIDAQSEWRNDADGKR